MTEHDLNAEYVRACPTCGRAESPDPIDLVRQLREALGMFAGAMPISPKQAWEEALAVARRLAGTREIDGDYERDDFFEDREVTERRRIIRQLPPDYIEGPYPDFGTGTYNDGSQRG